MAGSGSDLTKSFPWRRHESALPPEYDRLDRSGLQLVHLASGAPCWITTSRASFRECLASPFLSSDHSNPHHPAISSVKRERPANGDQPVLAYSGMDRPEHARHRRLVDRFFTTSAVASADRVMDAIVTQEVERFRRDPSGNMAEELSCRIAVRAIMRFVGVPAQARPLLARTLAAYSSPSCHWQAKAILGATLRRQVAGEFLRTTASPDARTAWTHFAWVYRADAELRTELMCSLLIAGADTSARSIAAGLVALWADSPGGTPPGKRPSTFIESDVDEVLRLCAVADLVCMRVATAGFEAANRRVKAGDAVVALTGTADHDRGSFADPDRLDFSRGGGVSAFGHGAHRCLGRHLAGSILGKTWSQLVALRGPGDRVRTGWPDTADASLLWGPTDLRLERISDGTHRALRSQTAASILSELMSTSGQGRRSHESL